MAEGIDVLPAKRYRRPYKSHDLYVIVTDDEHGKPYAVQVSASDEIWNLDQHLQSATDWGLRMTTLTLRAYGLDKAVRECRNCAIGGNTMAAIIADVLEEHGGMG